MEKVSVNKFKDFVEGLSRGNYNDGLYLRPNLSVSGTDIVFSMGFYNPLTYLPNGQQQYKYSSTKLQWSCSMQLRDLIQIRDWLNEMELD